MALSAMRHGVVDVRARWPDHAELGDAGRDQEGMGDEETRSHGQRGGALEGVAAVSDDVGVATVMSLGKTLQGGAAGAWGGLEGGPRGEPLAEEGGVVVVHPWQDRRQVVFQGTGETLRGTHVVAHEAAARVAAWCEGTQRGALGLQGRELIARRAQAFERERGLRGVVLGVARCAGFPGPGERERMEGQAPAAVVRSPRGAHMAMRVWENVPRGYTFAPHDCEVDIAGFITKGIGRWLIDGQEHITSAGDSYYLPVGTMFGLTVLEELSAVEVLSPPLYDR
jgi:quercetin dioxygenase-like cupin family protein